MKEIRIQRYDKDVNAWIGMGVVNEDEADAKSLEYQEQGFTVVRCGSMMNLYPKEWRYQR
jgi:hypothetical protein